MYGSMNKEFAQVINGHTGTARVGIGWSLRHLPRSHMDGDPGSYDTNAYRKKKKEDMVARGGKTYCSLRYALRNDEGETYRVHRKAWKALEQLLDSRRVEDMETRELIHHTSERIACICPAMQRLLQHAQSLSVSIASTPDAESLNTDQIKKRLK